MLLILFLCVTSSWALESRIVEPPIRVQMDPPDVPEDRAATRNVLQSWMVMPLDHFDPQNTATFQMRFMFNEEFFGGDGSPVFIMVGGEWAILEAWLRAGNMYEMARENHGFQIYTEHRYYGQTKIFSVFNNETLQYLNVDQALADLAYFIGELKTQARFANSKVILYGGSYAANMALWFKQRYPHLVHGVVASSGPIKAQVDFQGYLEVVHQAFLSEGGQQCIDTIQAGIDETIAAMATEAGRRELEAVYRLCAPLNYDSVYDLGYFAGQISWAFSTSVQQAQPGTLLGVCNNFATNFYGTTPMQKIGGYIVHLRNLGWWSCWNVSFEEYLNFYTGPPADHIAWYYQTCTEYGYYQTAPTSGTVFDKLKWLSVDMYVNMCEAAFDARFNKKFVYDAVDRVNLMFGGLEPNVNNTINIHGDIDPWHALGVHDRDLADTSPTVTVPRASHCFDMGSWRTTDTIRMSQAQQAARRLVQRWLQ